MNAELAEIIRYQPDHYPQELPGVGLETGGVRKHSWVFVRENWLPPLTGVARPLCHFSPGAEFVRKDLRDTPMPCFRCADIALGLMLDGLC